MSYHMQQATQSILMAKNVEEINNVRHYFGVMVPSQFSFLQARDLSEACDEKEQELINAEIAKTVEIPAAPLLDDQKLAMAEQVQRDLMAFYAEVGPSADLPVIEVEELTCEEIELFAVAV